MIKQKTKEEFKASIGEFIWEFKIGDNLIYDYSILLTLLKDRDDGKKYNQLISIISIAIIEGIMADFIYRLRYSNSDSHFPGLLIDKKQDIKNWISEKDIKKKKDSKLMKNFTFSDLIYFYEEFSLFEKTDKNNIYEFLLSAGNYRNRLHLKNYFKNFESNKSDTFTNKRTDKIVNCMFWIIEYFESNYPRKW